MERTHASSCACHLWLVLGATTADLSGRSEDHVVCLQATHTSCLALVEGSPASALDLGPWSLPHFFLPIHLCEGSLHRFPPRGMKCPRMGVPGAGGAGRSWGASEASGLGEREGLPRVGPGQGHAQGQAELAPFSWGHLCFAVTQGHGSVSSVLVTML